MPGETVLIVGTGHTAMDLAASVLNTAACGGGSSPSRATASCRGPTRTRGVPARRRRCSRPPTSPRGTTRSRRRRRGSGPIPTAGARASTPSGRSTATCGIALDEPTRRRFVTELRRDWEIHRSRISAGVGRDIEGWVAAGTARDRRGGDRSVISRPGRPRVETECRHVDGRPRVCSRPGRRVAAPRPRSSPGSSRPASGGRAHRPGHRRRRGLVPPARPGRRLAAAGVRAGAPHPRRRCGRRSRSPRSA